MFIFIVNERSFNLNEMILDALILIALRLEYRCRTFLSLLYCSLGFLVGYKTVICVAGAWLIATL